MKSVLIDSADKNGDGKIDFRNFWRDFGKPIII